MLQKVISVHITEAMWLSWHQDKSVRDGTRNHLIGERLICRTGKLVAQGKCVFRDKLRLQNVLKLLTIYRIPQP